MGFVLTTLKPVVPFSWSLFQLFSCHHRLICSRSSLLVLCLLFAAVLSETSGQARLVAQTGGNSGRGGSRHKASHANNINGNPYNNDNGNGDNYNNNNYDDVSVGGTSRPLKPHLRTGHQMATTTKKLLSLPTSVPAPTPAPPTTKAPPPDEEYFDPKTANLTHYEWETILVRKLFNRRRYNPQVRPAVNDREPVEVSIELVLLQINEMIEKDQEIVISGFLKIKWRDVRLTWTSTDFGGIEWVVTESTNCWLPDLALINSNDVYAVTRDIRFPLTLNASGDILYVPAGKIYARCELNLRFFPFDHQLCKYRFESWAYAAELVRITGLNFTIEPEHYMQNPEWEIPNAFVRTEIVHYESYNFSRVDFYMLLKRKSLFFITYTIFPCLALSTLQMMSHMLPFTEPERINFATTTLIAFSVFHVSIVEQMPHSSDAIPLLAIFVDALMCLIGLSLIECFVMMNWLSKVSGYSVPSPRLWFLVVDRFGDYLWLGSAGNYWRRNYLYVYERLNHKLDTDRRRRELERHRWKTAGHQYKMRRTSGLYNTKDAANFEALLYLVNKGDRRRGGATIIPPAFDRLQTVTAAAATATAVDLNENDQPVITVDTCFCEHQNEGSVASMNLANCTLPLSMSRNTLCAAQTPSSPAASSAEQRRKCYLNANAQQLPSNDNSKSSLAHIDDSDHPSLGNNNNPRPSAANNTSNQNRLSVDHAKRDRNSSESSVESFYDGGFVNNSNNNKNNKKKSTLSVVANKMTAFIGKEPVVGDKFASMGLTDERISSSVTESPAVQPAQHHHHHQQHHHQNQQQSRTSRSSSNNVTRRHRHSSGGNSKSRRSKSRSKSPSLMKSFLVANNSPATVHTSDQEIVAETALYCPRCAASSKKGDSEHVARKHLQQPSIPVIKNSKNDNNKKCVQVTGRGQLQQPSSPFGSYCNLPQAAGDQTNKATPDAQRNCLAVKHACRIDEIRDLVEEMGSHVTNNELKRECLGIWTTYITVVDRFLSAILCIICISFPIYLFVLFPEKSPSFKIP